MFSFGAPFSKKKTRNGSGVYTPGPQQYLDCSSVKEISFLSVFRIQIRSDPGILTGWNLDPD